MMIRFFHVILIVGFTVQAVLSQSILIVSGESYLEKEGNLGGYLRSLGYDVVLDPGSIDGEGFTYFAELMEPEKIAYLETFDLIIIHRATMSYNFVEDQRLDHPDAVIENWNHLRVPILNGSAYVARDYVWGWVGAWQAITINIRGVDIQIPDHPIVAGLTGEFFDTELDIDHFSPGEVGEGQVVATITTRGGEVAPAIVAWEPDQKFSPIRKQTHTHARVFLPIYRYHQDNYAFSPATGSFKNYTENGLHMIKQAIEYLLSFKTSNVSYWALY